MASWAKRIAPQPLLGLKNTAQFAALTAPYVLGTWALAVMPDCLRPAGNSEPRFQRQQFLDGLAAADEAFLIAVDHHLGNQRAAVVVR